MNNKEIKKRGMKKPLRTFQQFPEEDICPICKTNDNGECILIAMIGTQKERIVQAKPVHTGCLDLWIDQEQSFIIQKIDEDETE